MPSEESRRKFFPIAPRRDSYDAYDSEIDAQVARFVAMTIKSATRASQRRRARREQALAIRNNRLNNKLSGASSSMPTSGTEPTKHGPQPRSSDGKPIIRARAIRSARRRRSTDCVPNGSGLSSDDEPCLTCRASTVDGWVPVPMGPGKTGDLSPVRAHSNLLPTASSPLLRTRSDICVGATPSRCDSTIDSSLRIRKKSVIFNLVSSKTFMVERLGYACSPPHAFFVPVDPFRVSRV